MRRCFILSFVLCRDSVSSNNATTGLIILLKTFVMAPNYSRFLSCHAWADGYPEHVRECAISLHEHCILMGYCSWDEIPILINFGENSMPVAFLHFACVGEGYRILVMKGSGNGFTNATMNFMSAVCGMDPIDFMTKCTIIDFFSYARESDADPSTNLNLLKDEAYVQLYIEYIQAVLDY
jgi:hypothetical protein